MNLYIQYVVAILVIATLVLTALFAGTVLYHRYTGLSRSQAAMLWLLAMMAGILWFAISHEREPITYGRPSTGLSRSVFQVLLPLLAIPFVMRLYRKWIGGHLTEAEKMPGVEGVRAWLGMGNTLCATAIPLCLWGGFGYSPAGMLALTYGLLLAYPLLQIASQSAEPVPAVPAEDLSSEREKVLELLEAGRITADETAELLNALGHSAAPPARSATGISQPRKLVLAGACLLLAGFFLPWFVINPGQMVNEVASQFQQNMNAMLPQQTMLQGNLPNLNFDMGTMSIHAGNIAHGLGWWVLGLGIAAAVLPFFATTLEAAMQKKIILAALGAGGFILIYLLSDTFKYVSVGILLALVGYALELVGTLKERPLAR